MTTQYGLSDAGFTPKPVDIIKMDMEADHKAQFGAECNVSPSSYFGMIIGILAERFGALWDALESLYASLYPDTAGGNSLVAVCAYTGTVPYGATKTRVMATLGGTPGTVVQAGKQAKIPNTSYLYALLEDTVIDATGGAVALLECTQYGPVPCYAGTLTEIDTPVDGWASITNTTDHESMGRLEESDAALRARREEELSTGGKSACAAIREAVSHVDGVSSCTVYENDTDAEDASGLPPHSVEVVVEGGSIDEIAAAIWGSKAGGIELKGDIETTVEGADAQAHLVRFNRPTPVPVYVTLSIRKSAGFPTDGSTLLAQDIANTGDTIYATGKGGHVSQLYPTVFQTPGVDRILSLYMGRAAAPTELSIDVTSREKLSLDTSRITVTVV